MFNVHCLHSAVLCRATHSCIVHMAWELIRTRFWCSMELRWHCNFLCSKYFVSRIHVSKIYKRFERAQSVDSFLVSSLWPTQTTEQESKNCHTCDYFACIAVLTIFIWNVHRSPAGDERNKQQPEEAYCVIFFIFVFVVSVQIQWSAAQSAKRKGGIVTNSHTSKCQSHGVQM